MITHTDSNFPNLTATYDGTTGTATVTGTHPKKFCMSLLKLPQVLAAKEYQADQQHDDSFTLPTQVPEADVKIVFYLSSR